MTRYDQRQTDFGPYRPLRPLAAALKGAEEALEPFARMGKLIDDYKGVSPGPVHLSEYGKHFQKSRAALASIKAAIGETP